jgi:peptidoglycan/xylan/chitin deacetylase (PgdA/CDA1 family)
MKRKILNLVSLIGNLFPLKTLLQITKKNNICILYHTVTDTVPAHIKHLYHPRSIRQFEKDIQYLSRHFNFVSGKELAEVPKAGAKATLHLSFDDGLKTCADYIFPFLKKQGIPAIFFINPAFVDNKCMFHCHKGSILKEAFLQKRMALKNEAGGPESSQKFIRQITSIDGYADEYYQNFANQLGINFETYLKENPPYLRLDEIKIMQAEGAIFGGHTLTHPHLSGLPVNEQLEQIVSCAEWLRRNEITGSVFFAFPFEDMGISKAVFSVMKENGIEQSFGTSDMKEDCIVNHYHRISFENSNYNASTILKQQLFKYFLLKLAGRHKIARN